MKTPYKASPGKDIVSATMQLPIKGVSVDNPSGGWLYIVEANDFCPPYTLEWTRDLEYTASAITVRYGQAPAAQISTLQGDPYVLTLNSEYVGNSPGSAQQFIEQFTPLLGFFGFQTCAQSVSSATLVTAIANKRFRLQSIFMSLVAGDATNQGVQWQLAGSGNAIISGLLVPENPVNSFISPLDWPTGEAINFNGNGAWATTTIAVALQYQVI